MLNKKVLLLGLLLLAGGADCSAQISVLNKIKNKPKSVIRISLCRTAKRNPLIFPI